MSTTLSSLDQLRTTIVQYNQLVKKSVENTLQTLSGYKLYIKQAITNTLQSISDYKIYVKQFVSDAAAQIQLAMTHSAGTIKYYALTMAQSIKNMPQQAKLAFHWASEKCLWAINYGMQVTTSALQFAWKYLVIGFKMGYQFIINLPNKIFTLLQNIVILLKHSFHAINNLLLGFYKLGKIVANELYYALKFSLSYMWEGIKQIPDLLFQTFSAIKNYIVRVSLELLSLLKDLSHMCWEGIKRIPHLLFQAFSAIKNYIVRVSLELLSHLQDFTHMCWEGIKQIPKLLSGLWTALRTSVMKLASHAMTALNHLVSQSWIAFKWLVEKIISKLLIGVGTWYGISLAIVDLSADAANALLTNTIGMSMANLGYFEPTKMLLGGILATYTAYIAIKYTVIGASALVALFSFTNQSNQDRESHNGNRTEHDTTAEPDVDLGHSSQQVTLRFDEQQRREQAQNDAQTNDLGNVDNAPVNLPKARMSQ
tara:strand:+ start:73211 stop:74656 length:1446 start_codon:yes stop_codon:yes gene_type:complete